MWGQPPCRLGLARGRSWEPAVARCFCGPVQVVRGEAVVVEMPHSDVGIAVHHVAVASQMSYYGPGSIYSIGLHGFTMICFLLSLGSLVSMLALWGRVEGTLGSMEESLSATLFKVLTPSAASIVSSVRRVPVHPISPRLPAPCGRSSWPLLPW